MNFLSQFGPIGWAIRGGIKTAKTGWNLARGGPLQRGLLGAGVGGIIGGAQSTNDPNTRIENIAKGALLGGFVGSVAFQKGSLFGKAVPSPAIDRSLNVLGAKGWGWNKEIGKSIGRRSGKVGMFAAENPRTALGLGLAVTGVGGLTYLESNSNSFSPTIDPALGQSLQGELNPAYTPEISTQAAANLSGGTGQFAGGRVTGMGLGQNAKAFQNSTYGLTQGLHRGRHG